MKKRKTLRMRNGEGLTFEEWLYAANPARAQKLFTAELVPYGRCEHDDDRAGAQCPGGQPAMTAGLAIFYGVREEWNAWARGEDPTDWKQEWEAT